MSETPRWQGFEHQQLHQMINAGPGASASDTQTVFWQSLTKELEEVDTDLNKALNDLKATWQGRASDSANAGMTPLQEWATDAQTGSTVMRLSTEDQAQFISRARAEMPKPVEVTTPAPSTWDQVGAGAAALLGNPGPAAMVAMQQADHERQEAEKSAAAQQAVDTMNSYQSNSTWNRNTLGTFAPPPDVVVSTPPPTGEIGGWLRDGGYGVTFGGDSGTAVSGITTAAGGGGGAPPAVPSGSSGGSNLPGGGGGVGVGSVPLPQGQGNVTTNPSGFLPPTVPSTTSPATPGLPGGGPGTGPGGQGNPTALPGGGPFATGNLSGTGKRNDKQNPPSAVRGGPPGFGGFGPEGTRGGQGGSGGPGGLGGLGAGGVDADGRSAQQLGRGGATGLAGTGGEGVVARGGGATSASGARGGTLGAGPMAGGGRADGDEDGEHFAPDYLLETTDVFGDDRMVSPAVIGEAPAEDEK